MRRQSQCRNIRQSYKLLRPVQKGYGVFFFEANCSTAVFLGFIRWNIRWAHFVVSVDAESRKRKAVHKVFAGFIFPAGVVIQPCIAENDHRIIFGRLYVFLKFDIATEITMRIACYVKHNNSPFCCNNENKDNIGAELS